MGALQLEAMRDSALSERDVMTWHLQSNHYPPPPAAMVDTCLQALERARAGDFDTQLDLPQGVTWRGAATAPVSAVVDGYHLHAFLETGHEDGRHEGG